LDTETEPDTAARVDAFPLREQITYARHYLSLSVADFARLVRVERPAVYAWMDGENEPRAANQEQLNRLYRAALYVKERFGEPVGSLLRVTTSELRLPLFELLSADADEIHVKQAIDVLATLPRQHTRKKSLTERSDESLARGRMRALSMAGRRTK
jgi:DNA-binding transcriptional regulator YiaG